MKPSTGRALFNLAIDKLAVHDKTTAEALRRFASVHGRLDILEYRCAIDDRPPLEQAVISINWLWDPAPFSADELQDDFETFRQFTGKKNCHPRTLRRQHELLRAFQHTHRYPTGGYIRRSQRQAWCKEHLPAMISEAQGMPCWHHQPAPTAQDLNEILEKVGEETSSTKLSALIMEYLHPTTSESLLKRLLRRRGNPK
ncbi:MAG: hypothetical protein GDA65_02735 [Nitrospira sp. CR1.1]|nr:hypothetical protein [Nitrospira sp. CR1.1]